MPFDSDKYESLKNAERGASITVRLRGEAMRSDLAALVAAYADVIAPASVAAMQRDIGRFDEAIATLDEAGRQISEFLNDCKRGAA